MAVTINASTSSGLVQSADNSGIITLQNNGTNALTVDSGNLQFNSGYGSVATAYGCRAWVSFNGTGTPAIRGSGNVTSITDNGVGDYTVNFTTSMPNTNYCVTGTGGSNDNANAMMASPYYASTQLTGSSRIVFFSADGQKQDSDFNSVAIFR